MDTPSTDYSKLTGEHVEIAKDLLRGNSSRWQEFFSILGGVSNRGGYLCANYARRLRDECCGATVEDYCQHLQAYLRSKNNYVLATLIEINQHFFSEYFRAVLEYVYWDFFNRHGDELLKENRRRARKNLEPLTKLVMDDDESFDLHEVIASPEESAAVAARTMDLFADKLRKLWKSNQLDYLTLWMSVALNIRQDYAASVLGYSTANTVAARIRNFYNKKISYLADGTDTARQLDQWLKHSFTLQFAPDSGKWLLSLHIPFCCTEPEKRRIRVELTKENGSHAASATVLYGNVSCEIENGWGEMRLSDFHAAIRIRNGCVKVVDRNRKRFEGFPVFRNEPDVNVLNDEVFEKWSGCAPDASGLIADFGLGFAWLLNCDLDYERYGAPAKFQHSDLGAVSGEALILFAAQSPSLGCALPEHGFVFPVEWRYMLDADDPYSPLLPKPLIDLAKKIAEQRNVSRNWGLHPSFRFFHDRTDFSRQTVFGATDEAAASAYLSLSVALVRAEKKYTVPEPIFASAQYDWEQDAMRKINLLESKMHVASDWNADKFFVCESQLKEAEELVFDRSFNFAAVGCDSVEYAIFHFLEPLCPEKQSPLKSVPDLEYKLYRPALLKALSSLTNKFWGSKRTNDAGAEATADCDPPEPEAGILPDAPEGDRKQRTEDAGGPDDNGQAQASPEYGSFVILAGNPGMGKSILMSDLYWKYKANSTHAVFAFACNAGDKNCAENFVRSLSWQFASHSSDFAAAALKNASGLLAGTGIEGLYRKLVYEPLILTADRNRSHHYYILVDGLDEDASGMVSRLLSDRGMRFPANYAVTVSCRPVEPLLSELKARATGILDLNEGESAVICGKDLKKYIINYIRSNEDVFHCWQDADYDEDELREKIAAKDKSFLYATYVLQGVADGMYHFNQLDQELPAGLTAFYNLSFHYRFPTAREYEAVRPLLKILLTNGTISVEDASRQLRMPIGRLVRLTHGYCVVNDGRLSLSDTTLRDWLRDSIKNPDFSIF